MSGERNGVWVRTALLSWSIFAIYWGQIEWRASRFKEAHAAPQVRLLLSALDAVESSHRPHGSRTSSSPQKRGVSVSRAPFPQKKLITPRNLDLNSLDSAALEDLPRIGPRMAGRICRFRQALGGFHSVQQLREVWGMHEDQANAIIPWFHIGAGVYRSLCLNESPWNDFRKHPYFKYEGARIVDAYRKAHDLDRVEDLKNAIAVNDSLFRKWSPYLRLCKSSENDNSRRFQQGD